MVFSCHGVSVDPSLLSADLLLWIRTTSIVHRSWMTRFERLITEISRTYYVLETFSGCAKGRFIHSASEFFNANVEISRSIGLRNSASSELGFLAVRLSQFC